MNLNFNPSELLMLLSYKKDFITKMHNFRNLSECEDSLSPCTVNKSKARY